MGIEALVILVVVASTLWVGADAYTSSQSWGTIIEWMFGCLVLWVVAFPLYLAKRKSFT